MEQEDDSYVFAHFSSINCTGFKYIKKGDQVNFDIGGGKKDPAAVNFDVV
ncbi:MAG: cold shock domain-containing protein [Desulfobacterales bacterium]